MTKVRPAGGGAAEPAWQVDGPGGPGNPLSLRFNPGPCAASSWECPAATGAVAATGSAAWHHVAYVVSNSGHPSFNGDAYSRTFVDGVEVDAEDESPWTDLGVGNSEGMLIIGGNATGGAASGFTGLLDDVALFSGVVSDHDIGAIAAGTQAPNDPLNGSLLPANDPPVLGAPSETAVFPDGALVNCRLQQDSASVFIAWAFADQGETDLATWAGAEGGGGTGIGQYAPSAIPMSHIITGLLPSRHYVYRFFAVNALGHDWSSASGFTTPTTATAGFQGSLVAYWNFDTFYVTGNNPAGTPQGNHEGMFADLSGNNQTAYAADVSNGNFAPVGPGRSGNAFYSKSPVTHTNNAATNNHTLRAYLNGMLINWNGSVTTSFTVSNDIIDNEGDLTIGAFWRDGGWSYQRFISHGMTPDSSTVPGEGWIDDFAMWDVALGADTIGELAGGISPLFVGGASNPHAPVAADATFEVAENSPPGTDIGTVTASDADAGNTLTFSIIARNAAGLFAISPESGLISVAGPIDFETAGELVLTVVAADDGEPARVGLATITVNVINLMEDNGEVITEALTGPGGPFAGQSDPAVVGFDPNPDFDRWPNAFEVLFGFDAATPNDGTPLGTRFVDVAGHTFLEAVIVVDAAMDDSLTWHLEWSGDLSAWTRSENPHAVISETGGKRTISIRDDQPAAGTNSRFVRATISAGE